MDKLELKHLAPYLHYELKFDTKGYFQEFILTPVELDIDGFNKKGWKPILRPLSDLTKEIEHNGQKFVPFQTLYLSNKQRTSYSSLHPWEPIESFNTMVISKGVPQWIIDKLFEWHFDVFGLIEKGLAIDINNG